MYGKAVAETLTQRVAAAVENALADVGKSNAEATQAIRYSP